MTANFHERRAMTGIALRWVHLVVAIVVYLLSMGALYGSMRTELTDTRAALRELQEHTVRREQEFDRFREDLRQRLERVEWKIGEKQLRELQ